MNLTLHKSPNGTDALHCQGSVGLHPKEVSIYLRTPSIDQVKEVIKNSFPLTEEQLRTESIEDLLMSVIEQEGKKEASPSLTADNSTNSADAVVISDLKRVAPEKSRSALRFFVKPALTATTLAQIIAAGCGNVENPIVPPPTKEPTPASVPITSVPKPTFTPTSKPTELPTMVPTLTPESTPTRVPETTSLPRPAESPRPAEIPDVEEYVYDTTLYGVTIAYDQKDGLPAMYILPNGKKVFLDKEEVKQLKDKVITNQEPEIIEVIVADWNVFKEEGRIVPNLEKIQYSSEHPKTSELPHDIVSEEELKTRGIEIVQADNTHLYIRRGAFEEGEPLSDFKKNGKSSIKIVLINAPGVADYYIKDPRYHTFWGHKKDLEQDKQKKLEEWQRGLSSSLKIFDLKKAIKDSGSSISEDELGLAFIEFHVIEYKGVIAALKTMPFDLLADYIVTLEYPRGIYTDVMNLDRPRERSEIPAKIILAVGESKVKGLLFLYVNHKGEFGLSRSIVDGLASLYYKLTPRGSHTYPDPDDFIRRKSGSGYPYGPQTSGLVLRHEIAHDYLRHPKNNNQDANYNEWHTDLSAMEGIKAAWKKWEESGFTDNSGYHFVFSLPEGGYILTENKPSSSSAAPSV